MRMGSARVRLLAAYTPPLLRCHRKCSPEVLAAVGPTRLAAPYLLHTGFQSSLAQKRQQHMDLPVRQVTLPGLQLQLRRMGCSQPRPGLRLPPITAA